MAASRVTVSLSPSALNSMLSRPGGPGSAFLGRLGDRIAALARVNSATNGSIPRYIYVTNAVEKSVKVVSSNPHTLLVHNGSRPHPIAPRRRGGYLRFEVGGRVVYARRVNHPGYRGNPFLTDALIRAF